MKLGIKLALIAILPFIGNSCSDNDNPPTYDSQRIQECHNQQLWGMDEVQSKLVGQWEWKHAEYIYAIPPNNDLTGMKVEFRDDFTGTLTYSKVAPLEFTWSVGAYNFDFGISTDPLIPQLNGQILFCDDILLCGIGASGISDGVNNYYQKVQ